MQIVPKLTSERERCRGSRARTRLSVWRAAGARHPMTYTFQFRDVFAAWPFLLQGLVTTIYLSLVTMLLGLLIGIGGAVARLNGPKWLQIAAASYVEVIRNTPLLVQLFIVFFGLPSLGLRLNAITAALISLVINLGAYSI